MIPIPHPYTQEIFLAAIDRELKKRESTYPKMIERKIKNWAGLPEDLPDELNALRAQLNRQKCLLSWVKSTIRHAEFYTFCPAGYRTEDCFRELQRELRQRNSIYPRWIRWGLLDPVVAAAEINIWGELTKWFQQAFCPDVKWRKPPTRKTKQAL
jgi:hypothetical protein